MSICELWVRGRVESNGPQPFDLVFRQTWPSTDPLPTVSFQANDARGWEYYLDGFGGNFSGTGFYGAPEYYLKNCVEEPYDCLNGICVKKDVYNTPGIFASLADCQAICTSNGCLPPDPNYCPPGKVCIKDVEWSQIEQLTNQNRAKHCG